jgi:DNA-binding NarL/FixJ family response regulator
MINQLTKREIDILTLLSYGWRVKEIGNVGTVKNQLMAIKEKLNAFSITHAVAIAIRTGLI